MSGDELFDRLGDAMRGQLSDEEKGKLEEVRRKSQGEFTSVERKLFIGVGQQLITALSDMAIERNLAVRIESPSMDQLVEAASKLMPEGSPEAHALQVTATEGLTYSEQRVGKVQEDKKLAKWRIAQIPIRNNLRDITTDMMDPNKGSAHQNQPNTENSERALRVAQKIGRVMGFATKDNPQLPIGESRTHPEKPLAMCIREILPEKNPVAGKTTAYVVDITYSPRAATAVSGLHILD